MMDMAGPRTGETMRGLHTNAIGRAPHRRGELLDGMSPGERVEMRKRLAGFSGAKEAGISPEKAGVCFEEVGQHRDAGREFCSAADGLKNGKLKLASELYERAARDFILAGRSFEAVNACQHAAVCKREEAEKIARRLVQFCEEEAKRNEKAGEYGKAADQLGIAALILEPIDFVGAFSLCMKSEMMAKKGGPVGRGSPQEGGVGSSDDC